MTWHRTSVRSEKSGAQQQNLQIQQKKKQANEVNFNWHKCGRREFIKREMVLSKSKDEHQSTHTQRSSESLCNFMQFMEITLSSICCTSLSTLRNYFFVTFWCSFLPVGSYYTVWADLIGKFMMRFSEMCVN